MNKITTIVLVLFVLFFVGCGDEVTQVIQNPELTTYKKSVEFEFTLSPIIYSDHKIDYCRFQLVGQSNLSNFYNADIFLKKGNDLCYINSSNINEGSISFLLYDIQNCLGYEYIYEDIEIVIKLNSLIDITWEIFDTDLIINAMFYQTNNEDRIYYDLDRQLSSFEDYYESHTLYNPYSTYNDDFYLQFLRIKLPKNTNYIISVSNEEFYNNEDDDLSDLLDDLLGIDEDIVYTFTEDFQSDENGIINIYLNLSFDYRVVIKIFDKEKEEFIKEFEILESQIYEKEIDVYFVNPW